MQITDWNKLPINLSVPIERPKEMPTTIFPPYMKATMSGEGSATVHAGPSLYSKPSLPYLLSEYGFEDKETSQLRLQKEEQKKKERLLRKQARKTESFDSSEADKDLEKRREREEHYENMVKDLYKLRDYYYREYTGMLADKVERQRKEQRERDAALMKKKQSEMEEAMKASHHVKKRLERHTLASTPVTVTVPKTDLYRIVGLEEKLRREGKLRTISDYNKFREEVALRGGLDAYVRNKYPGETKSAASTTDYASSLRDTSEIFSLAPDSDYGDEVAAIDKHPRSLSRISEAHETSRPATRTENWAITQQYPSMYKQTRKKSITANSKQKDLERRFPKLEMPKLHCFTMNLAKKPPDPEEVRHQQELMAREKERKRVARTYTKMYQLAMSNAAVSSRILDLHEDLELIHGPDLCDVIADHHWMEAYGLREITPDHEDLSHEEEEDREDGSRETTPDHSQQQHETLPEITPGMELVATGEGSGEVDGFTGQSGSVVAITGESTEDIPRRTDSGRTKSVKSSGRSKKSLAIEAAPSPLPLTMNEVQGDCNIKEAKTLSTLWTNYLKAGKTIGT